MKTLQINFLAILIIFTLACNKSEEKTEIMHSSITDAKIKLYIKKIGEDPSNYNNYDNLAQNYIQKARETGDTDYYEKAAKTLNKSLEINPKNYVGVLLFAKTKMANHQYGQALNYAKKVIDLMPGRSVAYGILGDAYLELGLLSKAETAYKKMLNLKPGLDSYSRMSNLMRHMHDNDKGIKYMELAYESGMKSPSTPKENLAWTQVMIGSVHLDSGKLDEAETYFIRALAIFDGYYLAREHLEEVKYLR
ncbi:MAG: tetratricopeptide repeat protein [Thermodesulfobacteriota bacterium]